MEVHRSAHQFVEFILAFAAFEFVDGHGKYYRAQVLMYIILNYSYKDTKIGGECQEDDYED